MFCLAGFYGLELRTKWRTEKMVGGAIWLQEPDSNGATDKPSTGTEASTEVVAIIYVTIHCMGLLSWSSASEVVNY